MTQSLELNPFLLIENRCWRLIALSCLCRVVEEYEEKVSSPSNLQRYYTILGWYQPYPRDMSSVKSRWRAFYSQVNHTIHVSSCSFLNIDLAEYLKFSAILWKLRWSNSASSKSQRISRRIAPNLNLVFASFGRYSNSKALEGKGGEGRRGGGGRGGEVGSGRGRGGGRTFQKILRVWCLAEFRILILDVLGRSIPCVVFFSRRIWIGSHLFSYLSDGSVEYEID